MSEPSVGECQGGLRPCFGNRSAGPAAGRAGGGRVRSCGCPAGSAALLTRKRSLSGNAQEIPRALRCRAAHQRRSRILRERLIRRGVAFSGAAGTWKAARGDSAWNPLPPSHLGERLLGSWCRVREGLALKKGHIFLNKKVRVMRVCTQTIYVR